jgi:adenine/guanine phosphoribosyltransferase-like PRPP-binding protein
MAVVIKNHNVVGHIEYPVWKYPYLTQNVAKVMVQILQAQVLTEKDIRHVLLTTGSSGLVLASFIAMLEPYFMKDCQHLHLRKENESCHGASNVHQAQHFYRHKGGIPTKLWFLDDFIENGQTLRNVAKIYRDMMTHEGERANGRFIFAGGIVAHSRKEVVDLEDILQSEGVTNDFTLHVLRR